MILSKKTSKKKTIQSPVIKDDVVLEEEHTQEETLKKTEINNSEEKKQPNMEESFYYALNHEMRRQMIKIIGTNGECSFTTFKRTLKTSTGTLYHHLDVLKDLVTQNENRRYILTPLGKHAFSSLVKNYDTIESSNIDQQKDISRSLEKLIKLLVPKKIFDMVDTKPLIGILLSSVILVLSFLFVYVGTIDSSFIFFLPHEIEGFENIELVRLGLGFKFIAGVCLAAILSDILCRFLFQKPENTKKFFIAYSICLYPMLVYLIIYNLFLLISPEFVTNPFNKLIMFVFQFWSIWLLTYTLIKFKFIKLERSLIITLLIHYGAFSILLFSTL
jgi:hypothetical protein